MKDELLTISILEKQILKCWIDNPNLILEDDIFISETAKELQFILLNLIDEHKELNEEHILTSAIEYVSKESVIAIQETKYQVEKLNDYIQKLRAKNILHSFRNELLSEINSEDTDFDKVVSIQSSLDEAIEKIENPKENEGLSFKDLIDNHIDILKDRKNGVHTTTGDYLLDKIERPVSGIWTIVGYSGSCKSTFVATQLKTRIAKRLPTVYFNTELSVEGVMDGILPSLIKETYNDMRGKMNDDEHIDFDNIIDKCNYLAEHSDKSKFAYYPNSSVCINDIKKFCLLQRKKMNLKKNDLLFAYIAASIADLKFRRVCLDKIQHILAAANYQLDFRPRLSCAVASAQKVDRALAFWVSPPQLLALGLLVFRRRVLVRDLEGYMLFLDALDSRRHDL